MRDPAVALRHALLSIFGNMDSTSQKTNNVPGGKTQFSPLSLILFKKWVVSLMYNGCFCANGPRKYSVNADRFLSYIHFIFYI